MSLVVGVDSYVDVEQAREYIVTHYLSNDPRRAAWAELDTEDAEVLLRQATQEIERLPYRGIKRSREQVLSFPRCFDPDAVLPQTGPVISGDIYLDPRAERVPQAIMDAQVEEALETCSPTGDTETREIRAGAVKGYSIGHMSETFATAEAGSVEAVLASRRAQELVAPYVGGAYELR